MVFQYAVVKKAWLDIHYHARSLKKIHWYNAHTSIMDVTVML